ncbi:MAG: oligosaccharide flippase family protein [Acidobacteriia bacterium]|nr:oligosaccharide flippase family protein [Terriglobia bacterium]
MPDYVTNNDAGRALAFESGNNAKVATSLNTLRAQLLKGGLTLLAGTGLVGILNLAHNIAVARLLGPTGYGHAAAVFTLLMLVSAITLAFQILCAKLVAGHDSPADKAGVYVKLHRKSWTVGITLGLLLTVICGPISGYLNLPNPLLIALLGLGTAFYIPLGVRRGYTQGICAFAPLARNFLLEGLVRLGGALLLIKLGLGITGAVEASVAAIVGAYLLAKPKVASSSINHAISVPFREALQAIVFFAGQVVINNFDIILVKHFFPSEEAGIYAAVALVGRLVNVCSWSVVNSMFPVSASRRAAMKKDTPLLMISLALVFVVLALLIGGLLAMPNVLWRLLYGAQFELASYGRISSLVVLYAVTSGLYALSSVVIAYEMSRKIANTGWVQLAFSGALIAGIYFFHANLFQVVLVQFILICLLLFVVVALFALSFKSIPLADQYRGTVRPLRSLSEDEVIAEFLRNEFHRDEFAEYREAFRAVVDEPNFDDHRENSLRRSLLYLRRGSMWRELPSDTEWFEVELTLQDLAKLRVFPRAPWRRAAQGSFELVETVERIRSAPRNQLDPGFLSKLQRLSPLVRDDLVNRTVLLIGTDKDASLTILDGNHRIAAAMLMDPAAALKQFRLICGFSVRMTECCWYKTNVATLWRYAKNLVRYMPHDPNRELRAFLQTPGVNA